MTSDHPTRGRTSLRSLLTRLAEYTAAAFILLLALALAYAIRKWEPMGRADEEAVAGPKIEVARVGEAFRVRLPAELVQLTGIEAHPVEPETVPLLHRAPAVLEFPPDRQYRALALFPGRVAEVRCSVGQQVHPNEPLCVLESQAVAEAKVRLLRAMAQYEAASQTYDRLLTLQETRLVKQQELIDARQKLAEAEAELRGAKGLLTSWGLSQEELERVVAQRDTSPRLTVRSPITGTVTEIQTVPGESVQPGQLLVQVADASVLWVRIQVDEETAARVQVGQQVRFRSIDATGEPLAGTVFYIAPQLDPRTRKVTIYGRAANETGRYRAGMFGDAEIVLEPSRPRLLVPAEAVHEALQQHWLAVQVEAGHYEVRAVRVQPREEGLYEVVQGLEPGEAVVVQGGFFLVAEVLKRYPDLSAQP